MQHQTAILAAVLALGAAGIGRAQAQAVYIGPGVYDARAYGPAGRVYDGSIPPFEVMRVVRSTGLIPLSRPMRRGPYYEVIAANRAGGQMRVVVDAFAGDIVKVNPILAGGPYGPRLAAPYDPQLQPPRPVPPYGVARMPPPYEGPEIKDPPPGSIPHARVDHARVDEAPPVPPRNVPLAPQTRVATAPDATGALRPPAVARTPMPRPRPVVAAREAPAATPDAAAPTPMTPAVSPAVAAVSGQARSPLDTAPPAAPTAAAGEPKLVPVAPLE